MRVGFTLILAACFLGCDATDAQRFRDQSEWFRFESQSVVIEVFGGRLLAPRSEPLFRCPTVTQWTTRETTVLTVAATTPMPYLQVRAESGLRCDQADSVGIELRNLPLGTVDVFRNCDPDHLDRYVTRCANVVESCDGVESVAGTCVKVIEGRYRLMASSEYLDDPICRSAGEGSREPYATVTEACVLCDALEAHEVTAAYRGESPDANGCCEDTSAHLAFCVKPCVCRQTTFRLEIKEAYRSDDLRLAVVSDVEGNRGVFRDFVASARAEAVQWAVNIGDLTASGARSQLFDMAALVRDLFSPTGELTCPSVGGQRCCGDESGAIRTFPEICNTIEDGIAFTNGLGENETSEESFYTFFQLFGPTSFTATYGNVQMIMLDSADATISGAQFAWLARILSARDPRKIPCRIPGTPPGGEQWPLIETCPRFDCNSCIDGLAICVPPPSGLADTGLGPRNCQCIPAMSTPCPGNFTCEVEPGQENGTCRCTRDADCGMGARCKPDGSCAPPLRLFFTHTPPFDAFGARNSALRSRREAARLVALLRDADVHRIFAGAVNTFASVSIAGIPIIITGGGGASLEVFDRTGHHWILVKVPGVFGDVDQGAVQVEPIRL